MCCQSCRMVAVRRRNCVTMTQLTVAARENDSCVVNCPKETLQSLGHSIQGSADVYKYG